MDPPGNEESSIMALKSVTCWSRGPVMVQGVTLAVRVGNAFSAVHHREAPHLQWLERGEDGENTRSNLHLLIIES